MHHWEDPDASREGEGLILEMEWVPWCWIVFFSYNEHRQQPECGRVGHGWLSSSGMRDPSVTPLRESLVDLVISGSS